MGTICSCLILLVIVAAFRMAIGAGLPSNPPISYSFPQWAPAGWNEQTISKAIHILPRKSTFIETLLAFPLFLGWWVHYHQTWGLPLIFAGTVLVLGIWYLTAHLLGNRKPSVLFPALIMLQCAALGWGLTFYIPLPYYPQTHLSVFDLKSTFPGILTAPQQVNWYVASGYTGFSTYSLKGTIDPQQNKSIKALFIPSETANAYAAQLSSQADWWLFPQHATSIAQLKKTWKAGKCVAVSLKTPPRTSWQMLPAASRINLFISVIVLIAFAVLYGIQPAAANTSAPSRIMNFLQKRRRPKRWGGLVMMLLACLGTILSLWLTFYPAWGFERLETLSLGTAVVLWIALDFAYWQGRKSWRRKH